MTLNQSLLNYSLAIFDSLAEIFIDMKEFFDSFISQVELNQQELEIAREMKESLNKQINMKENELIELEDEIKICNQEIQLLNKELYFYEKKISFIKNNYFNRLNSVKIRKFKQPIKPRQPLTNMAIDLESIKEMRSQSQVIRNHAKEIRIRSSEIIRNIRCLTKEFNLSISNRSSLSQSLTQSEKS